MANALKEHVQHLERLVKSASQHREQLVLVVGPTGSGKTALLKTVSGTYGWPHINVGLVMAEGLAPLSKKDRARQARDILLANMIGQAIYLLDNTELLFEPELQIDPVRLLRDASKTVTVVASILGTVHDGTLLHGIKGQEDAKRGFPVHDALVLQLTLE